jgi:ABC-2 type transport system permease protein
MPENQMTAASSPRATSRATRVSSGHTPLLRRVVTVYRYRELLVGLVRKELKVKYKNSVLGALWSMLNPLLYLVVFYVVFQLFLKSGIPKFPIFLLSGLLVWNFFSTSLMGATVSVVSNGALLKKVSFPREVLPLAPIGAGLVHFFLQALVLALALTAFRYEPALKYSLLIIPALVVLVVFTAALGILLAALNVQFRDMQHLLELALVAWFWMTPIVYPFRLVADRLDSLWPLFLNPVTPVVITFQRAIYNRVDAVGSDGAVTNILPTETSLNWYLLHIGIVGLLSVVLLGVALTIFGRLEGNFAEEL